MTALGIILALTIIFFVVCIYCMVIVNSTELERKDSDEGFMEWLEERKKKGKRAGTFWC